MKGKTKMESNIEADLSAEDHDIEDVENEPSHEDYVLVAKAVGTVVVVGMFAVYGASVATYQAACKITKMIQERKTKKKEELEN
jgi:hypothetical protein